MISFNCPRCNSAYRVGLDWAGHRTRCNRCQEEIVVPVPAVPVREDRIVIAIPDVSAPSAARLPMRTRRLLADFEQMQKAFQGFPLIAIESREGNPPDLYRIA